MRVLTTLFFLATTFVLAFGQDTDQRWAIGKSYRTNDDLTVNYIDGNTIKQRIALAGLKYKYVETVDSKVYIKFFTITSDNTVARDNDNYVNSSNDEIVYFVLEDKFKEINKQKTFRLVSGTLLAPIKIRPEEKIDNVSVPWELSTDITLGQYLGLRFPVSKRNPYYLTVPTFTIGTSLLSINSSNTNPQSEKSTTLGLTWSTGIILDLNGFNLGFILGRDYAPGSAGQDWIYNERTWYSIGFGINLTSKNRDL